MTLFCRAGILPTAAMARPLRIAHADALYHLCSRGVDRRAVFEDDADRARFVGLLAASALRYDVAVHAWVLLGNHFPSSARPAGPTCRAGCTVSDVRGTT